MSGRHREVGRAIGRFGVRQLADRRRAEHDAIARDQRQIRRDDRVGRRRQPANASVADASSRSHERTALDSA